MTKIDLSRTTGLLTPGVHAVQLIRVNETQGPKGPCWNYTGKCVDNSDDRGKELLIQVSLAPGAGWKKDAFLDAVGAPKKGTAGPDSFLGKILRGVIETTVFNGTKRSKMTSFISKEEEGDEPISGSYTPEEEEENQELLNLFGDESTATEEALVNTTVPGEEEDEDLISDTTEELPEVNEVDIGSGLPEDATESTNFETPQF